jgi:hypothetical protein
MWKDRIFRPEVVGYTLMEGRLPRCVEGRRVQTDDYFVRCAIETRMIFGLKVMNVPHDAVR